MKILLASQQRSWQNTGWFEKCLLLSASGDDRWGEDDVKELVWRRVGVGVFGVAAEKQTLSQTPSKWVILHNNILMCLDKSKPWTSRQHSSAYLWKPTNNVMDPEGSYIHGKYALWTSDLESISLTTPLPVAITITASTATILTKSMMWNHINAAPIGSGCCCAVTQMYRLQSQTTKGIKWSLQTAWAIHYCFNREVINWLCQ